MPLHFAIGAFVPFFFPFVGDVLHKFGGAAADLAASPSSRTRSASCYRFLAAARAICCSRRPCSLCRSSPYSPGKLKFSTLRYILRYTDKSYIFRYILPIGDDKCMVL